MNDNPVELAETHIRLNISEMTAVGTELTRVNATDRDIGSNGKVNAVFRRIDHSNDDDFSLDRSTTRSVMVFRRPAGWITSVLAIQRECKTAMDNAQQIKRFVSRLV